MQVPTFALLLTLSAALGAQTNTRTAQDVGLTLAYGTLTQANAVVGQACGAFTCVPFSAPLSPAASNLRTVNVYGDANSLYVLMMSFASAATPCAAIPGIANSLILGQPAATLAIGVTGPYLPSTTVACRQGVASIPLSLPVRPTAVPTYTLQALTFSFAAQGPALTVAVQGR